MKINEKETMISPFLMYAILKICKCVLVMKVKYSNILSIELLVQGPADLRKPVATKRTTTKAKQTEDIDRDLFSYLR